MVGSSQDEEGQVWAQSPHLDLSIGSTSCLASELETGHSRAGIGGDFSLFFTLLYLLDSEPHKYVTFKKCKLKMQP